MKHYPMKLAPITKSTVWGGSRLKSLVPNGVCIPNLGEARLLSVRHDGISAVDNGEYSGMPLDAILADGRERDSVIADFPLLIKFLDAADALSVQVHPDSEYAALHCPECGKTEMWYVLHAEQGAQIVYGLADGATVSDLADAVKCGKIESVLNYVKVKAGDVFFIPPGQIHALGKGVTVAEVQTNSDITYRLYDYCRRDKDGKLRELHVDRALDVARVYSPEELYSLAHRSGDAGIIDCEFFRVGHTASLSPIALPPLCGFTVLIGLRDGGRLYSPNECYPVNFGDCYFIPEQCTELRLSGESLTVHLPK